MPLQDQKSNNAYVKISKIYISNSNRTAGSAGPYDYFVTLPEQIQYVIGFEITAFQFPTSIAPTFVPPFKNNPGTDKVDFILVADPPGITKAFSFTWPAKQYTFQNVTVPYLSYVDALQQQLRAAIAADPVFGIGGPNEATFTVVADPNLRTYVTVTGVNVTGMRFMFASGPNQLNSAHIAMGFVKVDTPLSNTQVSMTATQLRPFRFIDINLDAAPEFKPLKRIYVTDSLSAGSVRNDLDITRTRLLSSQPLRTLTRLRVRITLENGVVPPDTGAPHDFTLTVFSIANEINAVPSWLRQTFVL